jgi:hypothetical protein
MRIRNTMYRGRKVWEMDNDEVSLVMTVGGGHIAAMTAHERPGLSPLWAPVWKSMEPWQYNPRKHDAKHGSKLLAAILGHNLCLGWFGDPSDEEAKQGLTCHGEAPVAKWRLVKKSVSKNGLSMTCSCVLPVAQMEFIRTLTTRRVSNIIDVREEVRNLSKRDLPFTMCQHVTVSAPFLEKGVTTFDMPATKCHTFPGKFGDIQRLKQNTSFVWPKGPGAKGSRVDMRMIGKEYRKSSDFSAQLMDPKKRDAWFAAVNPKLGLLLAYVWRRSDFPWVGNWEENYGRKGNPWAGKSLTRGMEFTNTPFPVGLKKAVTMGKFHGQPTYRWLPAKGKVNVEYSIVLASVPSYVKGVASIERSPNGFGMDLMR